MLLFHEHGDVSAKHERPISQPFVAVGFATGVHEKFGKTFVSYCSRVWTRRRSGRGAPSATGRCRAGERRAAAAAAAVWSCTRRCCWRDGGADCATALVTRLLAARTWRTRQTRDLRAAAVDVHLRRGRPTTGFWREDGERGADGAETVSSSSSSSRSRSRRRRIAAEVRAKGLCV